MNDNIVVDANLDFSTASFEISGYEGEFDEGGVVEIETPCCCGTWTTTCLTIEQLQEIVDAAKEFRAARLARQGE